MGDLLQLVICQFQLQEALNFLHRIPHGIIGAVSHALSTIAIDKILWHTVFHKHHGAGNIQDTVFILQLLIGLFIHFMAAKMRRNDIQFREQIQYMTQACRA